MRIAYINGMQQLEMALNGLDQELDDKNTLLAIAYDGADLGLGAWWNPVDWAKGAGEVVGNINDAVGILREQYEVLKQTFASAQQTYTEISTFWRGVINNGGDIQGRLDTLKKSRANTITKYDKAIAQVGGKNSMMGKMLEKKKASELRDIDKQTEMYDAVMGNIKKISEGLWGAKSPFGQLKAGVEDAFKNLTKGVHDVTGAITKGFNDFKVEGEKLVKDLRAQMDKYALELSKIAGGLQASLKDITKASQGTMDEIMKVTAELRKQLTVQGDQLKALTSGFDNIKQMLNLQQGQFTEVKAGNIEAKKYYENSAKYFQQTTDIFKSIEDKLSTIPKLNI